MEPERNVCLFGGSFDPIHKDHIRCAEYVQNLFHFDRFYFLPCKQNVDKGVPLFSDMERLELLEVSLRAYPWAKISCTDMLLAAPNETFKLVKYWKEVNPNHNLYWLMGSDSYNTLPEWGGFEYLNDNLNFIVFQRPGVPIKANDIVRSQFFISQDINLGISSTVVRQLLAQDKEIPHTYFSKKALDTIKKLFSPNLLK